MSDPAAEAAQKCWTGFSGGMFTQTDPEYLGLLDAAREVLKPIRELHKPNHISVNHIYCEECDNLWPCTTAKLTYTSEELAHV